MGFDVFDENKMNHPTSDKLLNEEKSLLLKTTIRA